MINSSDLNATKKEKEKEKQAKEFQNVMKYLPVCALLNQDEESQML